MTPPTPLKAWWNLWLAMTLEHLGERNSGGCCKWGSKEGMEVTGNLQSTELVWDRGEEDR